MSNTTQGGGQRGPRPGRIKLTYRGYRITLVREGWRRWRNYIAGPPGVGGLSYCAEPRPLSWALLDAIWDVQDRTKP